MKRKGALEPYTNHYDIILVTEWWSEGVNLIDCDLSNEITSQQFKERWELNHWINTPKNSEIIISCDETWK